MKKDNRQAVRYRVLNPLGHPAGGGPSVPAGDAAAAPRQGQAPRLDFIDGKTIYLVDVGFGGGNEFLKEMQEWLSRNRPGVNTVLRRKKGNMFLDDPDLWNEVKDKGHAVVLGVGG